MLAPIQNPELYGHEAAEAQLFKLIGQHKLPHALLFSGQEGIGKATLAYRLARYLLTGADAAEPIMGLFGPEPIEENLRTDMEQPAVRRMIAGSHGDLLVVQPVADDKRKTSADTIFIEQIREVVDFMHHTPAESSWRVVIIEPAEAMNTAAANALLKVLEEPPANALLILVTHQAGRLLPTIRSRCRKITLRAPDEAACAKIFDQQEQSIPEDTLHQLRMLAQGSAGKALQYYERNALDLYADILEVLASPTPKEVTAFAARAAKAGAEQWQTTQALLMQAIYRISLYAATPEHFMPLNTSEEQAFAAMLTRQSLPHWLELWERAGIMLPQTNSLTMDKTQTILSLLRA